MVEDTRFEKGAGTNPDGAEVNPQTAINEAQNNATIALKKLIWLYIAIPAFFILSLTAFSFSFGERPMDSIYAMLLFSPLPGIAAFFIITLAKDKAQEYSSALHIIALSGIYLFAFFVGLLVFGIGGLLYAFASSELIWETIPMVSAEILSIPALVFSINLYKASKQLRTTKEKPNHTASCFLGGISIILTLTTMYPVLAIIFGAIGVLVAIVAKNKYYTKIGLIMNVAGVAGSIIALVIRQ